MDKPYLVDKFQKPEFDPSTGLDNEIIKENLMGLVEELGSLPHTVIKAKAFEYVTQHVQIDVNSHDYFVGFGCWDRHDRPLTQIIDKWNEEVDNNFLKTKQQIDDSNASGASLMWKDFDHSAPDWDAIFELGFPGLLERARCYRKEREDKGQMTDAVQAYFDGIEITYSAILEMLVRFRDYALEHADGNKRIQGTADCLNTLIHGAPTNTYEVLQLIYLFFMFGEHIDRFQVRSLNNLDRTIYPYYLNDLKEKRYTEEQIRELFAYFMMQWASIDNYWGHPFYLGGTKKNGESEINDLSYLILDVFDELSICTPKIQIKKSANTPVKFTNKVLDMIRRGNSSFVFVSEEGIKRAMLKIGVSEEDAGNCDITGCYEFIPRGRGNSTAVGYINMLKPLEQVFNNGVGSDFAVESCWQTLELASIKTFEDFYQAYIKKLDNIIETVILCGNDFEQYLSTISPAQVFSATIENSLKIARDAFQDGSVYNFSMILEAGFATAVDALMAVREFVFDKQEFSLSELENILENNWEGYEKTRLKVLRSKYKFGNGIDCVDELAERLARHLSEKINKRPNARGGCYMASVHSARTFIILGEKTGATPDGRLAGEEMSKNISPTMGMDTNGVTALVKSVTRIDSAMFPGDFPLDVMMHPTVVQGEEGLAAMRCLLNVYMKKHGIAMHFNVFDADVLLDAQKYPDKHSGLQVRVCGWNVHFNDICKKEQDAYIKRAQNISE